MAARAFYKTFLSNLARAIAAILQYGGSGLLQNVSFKSRARDSRHLTIWRLSPFPKRFLQTSRARDSRHLTIWRLAPFPKIFFQISRARARGVRHTHPHGVRRGAQWGHYFTQLGGGLAPHFSLASFCTSNFFEF